MHALSFTLVALLATNAYAQHEHAHDTAEQTSSAFGVGASLVAATYDTMLYVGNYQGVLPTVSWSNARFGVIASGAAYAIERNGARSYGFGDLHVHGQASLLSSGAVHAGVIAGVSAPTGDSRRGLGMGHAMVMPAAFVAWGSGRFATSATGGYSRALGGDTDHDHGMWPLVEPMNMAELTWSASGDIAIAPNIRTGARVSGGVPIGNGDNRVIGTLRVAWRAGRVDSSAELQAGLAGDPFTVRGVVSTALSF